MTIATTTTVVLPTGLPTTTGHLSLPTVLVLCSCPTNATTTTTERPSDPPSPFLLPGTATPCGTPPHAPPDGHREYARSNCHCHRLGTNCAASSGNTPLLLLLSSPLLSSSPHLSFPPLLLLTLPSITSPLLSFSLFLIIIIYLPYLYLS